ncbi:MAG: NUDIX domain-containing protein [bacterium]
MHTRYIVSAIVQQNDNILLGRKAKGKPPYPDAWHLPGGGIEEPEQAAALIEKMELNDPYLHAELRREVMEELGIEITNIRCIVPEFRPTVRQAETVNKDGEPTHYYFLEYLCDFASGEVVPGDDLAEARWFSKDELKGLVLTPPSQEMYRELGWI